MKQLLMIVVSLALAVLVLAACQLPRPDVGGDVADIPDMAPTATTPAVADTPTSLPAADTPVPQDTTAPAPQDTPVPAPQDTPAVDEEELSPLVYDAPVEPAAVVPGEILVKLNEPAAIQAMDAEAGADAIVATGLSSLDQRLRDIGATGLDPVLGEVASAGGEDVQDFAIGEPDVGQLYAVSFPPENDPLQMAAVLEQDPAVVYAEPNFVAGIVAGPAEAPPPLVPNDPYYRYQWSFDLIQMPAAWDISTGAGTIVAIVDTGIDFRAPDLANARRRDGYDFVNNDTDPTDDQGHGTHVAGTVAQTTNNALGVAGTAFDTTLLPVKVLDDAGLGSYENIIKGVVYAVDQGADVINLSLAGRNGSQALQEAMEYARARGVLVVAAAGNASGPVSFPAAYDDSVLAVGAIRYDKTLASYSNFGPEIDLVAPGGDTSVDQNNDTYADGIVQQTLKLPGPTYSYLFFEGTSMASPHVAGLAALIFSLQPELSPAEVESIMVQTAENLGNANQYGAGLIQAAAALEAASGPAEPTPTSTPSPVAATDTPTPSPTPVIVTLTPTPTPTTAPPTGTPTATPTVTPEVAAPTDTPTVTPEVPGPTVTQTATPEVPGPTGTPTATPQVPPGPTGTPTPAMPGTDLLTNGGFENSEGWVLGDTPIRGFYSTDTVRSGSQAVCLGAVSGPTRFSFSSVWQQVTIPAEARQVTLNAWIYPISQDAANQNIQYIMVLNRNFRPVKTLSQGLSNSQTWEQVSYDLSEFAGQTVYVYFSVVNRSYTGQPSAMCVDDVALTWSN